MVALTVVLLVILRAAAKGNRLAVVKDQEKIEHLALKMGLYWAA